MTSGSYTIGGTSPDYATIAAWDAAVTGNLTGIVEGKCRATTFSENVVLDAGGFTTSASNYMKLTYDTGAFHAGVFAAGVVVDPADSLTSHAFQLDADYTRVIGIEVTGWNGGSSEAFRVNGDNCRIEQCLIHGANDVNADGVYQGTSGITIYVSNCLFAWLGRTSIHVQTNITGTIYAYNCTAVYMACAGESDGNCGMGYDLSDPPLTSHTFHIKNCYVHIYGSDVAATGMACYSKPAVASWGNSTHNASSDATASDTNGTYYQNNAAVADQLMQACQVITVGENSGDDYSGSCEDTWINSGSETNFGSDTELDIDNADRNVFMRWSLANVPGTVRVKAAWMYLQIYNEMSANAQIHCAPLLRNWTEGGMTWNTYDGSNNWTTAGGTSDGNDIDFYGLQSLSERCWTFHSDAAIGEYHRASGGEWFWHWVQDAIDGSSGAPKGNDWVDLIFDYYAGSSDIGGWYSAEATDGTRPYLEIWYDTAAAPFDARPDASGVLDGNGTDLSSDGYPISVDITGASRSTWDIGAWNEAPPQTLTGTLVTQAGVGYDGVLSSEAFLAGALIEQAGVPNLGTLHGADFLPPVIDYFGDQWTGSHKDIDEEPASDVDFIASPAAANPVILLDEGFEAGTSGWSLDPGISRVNPGDAYEGSYVLRGASSSIVEARYTDPHPAWPVDPNALYRISFAMRHSGTAGQFYAAIRTRNASGVEIYPWMQAVYQHSLTWLTVATSPTDTTITVADASQWVDGNSAAVIVFDALPDMSDIEAASIPSTKYRGIAAGGISGNVITLAGAETVGASYPAGTWVRCHRHTGTFMYPMANLQPGDSNWHTYSKLFGGIRSLRDRFFSPQIERGDGDTFRMASVDFTVSFLMNYQATDANQTDLDAVKIERLDNAKLMRVAITQEVGIDGSDHLRYRIRKDVAVGTVNVKVSLLQKSVYSPQTYLQWDFTEIESWQHNNVGTGWTDYKQTITNDAGITNRAELYLMFEVTSS